MIPDRCCVHEGIGRNCMTDQVFFSLDGLLLDGLFTRTTDSVVSLLDY